MLNSGKKLRALRDKKKYILPLVLSEVNVLNETKNHNPLLQFKWSVPKIGPNRVPWGTPDVTGTVLEDIPFTTTVCVRSDRKAWIQSRVFSGMP